MTNKELEMTSRVRDQVKTNTQRFLDELDKIDKDYKYIVKAYLIYLQKIGCIAYDYDYFGDHYLVAVKRKEVVQ